MAAGTSRVATRGGGINGEPMSLHMLSARDVRNDQYRHCRGKAISPGSRSLLYGCPRVYLLYYRVIDVKVCLYEH